MNVDLAGWSRPSGVPNKPGFGLLGQRPAVKLLEQSALAAEVLCHGELLFSRPLEGNSALFFSAFPR